MGETDKAQKMEIERLKLAEKENENSVKVQLQEKENLHQVLQEKTVQMDAVCVENVQMEKDLRKARWASNVTPAEFARMAQQREREHPSLVRDNNRLIRENGELKTLKE